MTAAEAIEIVRRVGNRPYACVHEQTSAYSFTKQGEPMAVLFALFIQPGIGDEKCSSYRGDSIFECANKAVNALMNEHSAKPAEAESPAADGIRREDVEFKLEPTADQKYSTFAGFDSGETR